MESYSLDSEYKSILTSSDTSEYELIVRELSWKLPALWSKAYKNSSNRVADICVINYRTFNYIFDDYEPTESNDLEKQDSVKESRIVAVFGTSNPQKVRRDDYRLQGWQKRSINRGWSERGKVFRKMERYCFENKDVFCFNRPIYLDESSKPAMYEFGILKIDGSIWVEVFDNRKSGK